MKPSCGLDVINWKPISELKMNLKNVVLVAAMMIGTTVMAQGSGEKGKEQMRERTEAMIQELGLNDKQAQQYREMVSAHHGEMKALRQAEREGAREKVKELRDAHQMRVKEILTDEQWAAYQEKKEKMRAKGVKRAERMKEKQENPTEPEPIKQELKNN